jgi:hypothetical protein
MLLSDAYRKYKKEPTTYACCVQCRKAWLDDAPLSGPLNCPRCSPEIQGSLYRGATDPSQYGCTLDTGEELPQVSDDPGRQTRSISSVKSKI